MRQLTPASLGLPQPEWRPYQLGVIDRIVSSKKRFVVVCLPPGSGKSIIGLGAARMLKDKKGWSWAYLVKTLELQNQIREDVPKVPDVRGASNYTCRTLGTDCQQGKRDGCTRIICSSCPYENAKETANSSDELTTNYAMWLSAAIDREAFQTIVADEAHTLEQMITDHATLELKDGEYAGAEEIASLGWDDTVSSLKYISRKMKDHQEAAVEEENQSLAMQIRRDRSRIADIVKSKEEDWAVDLKYYGEKVTAVTFRPVWVGKYAGAVWAKANKVILMSGTISKAHLFRLGIKQEDTEFISMGAVFDQARCPVIFVPTGRMRYGDDVEAARSVHQMDRILARWGKYQTVVHSGSHQRTRYIVTKSQHRNQMSWNEDSRGLKTALVLFKPGRKRVLVSASVTTGYSFDGSRCRVVIVPKIPYPAGARVDNLMKKRMAQDRNYTSLLAGQTLVQSCYRGMRSAKDWCVIFITDDMLRVLWMTGVLPDWFEYEVRRVIPGRKDLGL